jgi:AcrR family transcriptional regulator
MKDRRETIADEFQRRFNHFGFQKTSVAEVARELQISKKTIYQHFNSKEEIFYYVVSRIAARYRKKMAQELEALPTYRERIEQLIGMVFAESRKWLKHDDTFEFKYKYEIGELAFQDTYQELITQLVRAGTEAGEFSASEADITSRFIRGIIAESMKLLRASPETEVEADVLRAVFRLLH